MTSLFETRRGLNMNSERIPRSLLRGLASELQSMDIFFAWMIHCLWCGELQFLNKIFH
jgi:hypothetical protein